MTTSLTMFPGPSLGSACALAERGLTMRLPQLPAGQAEPQEQAVLCSGPLQRPGLNSPRLPHPPGKPSVRRGLLPLHTLPQGRPRGGQGEAEARPRLQVGRWLERSKHQPSGPYRRLLFPRNKQRQRKHTWNLNLVKFAEPQGFAGSGPGKNSLVWFWARRTERGAGEGTARFHFSQLPIGVTSVSESPLSLAAASEALG